MKIGIIIVFHNNETDIEKDYIINQIKKAQDLKLCLVNNSSQDKTYQLLKFIKESCDSNVSIVDIKRHVSEKTAIRAGARYMFNQFSLSHIGHITTSSLPKIHKSLNNLFKTICENQEVLLEFDIEILKKQDIKFRPFQDLFSIVEYFNKKNNGSIPSTIRSDFKRNYVGS